MQAYFGGFKLARDEKGSWGESTFLLDSELIPVIRAREHIILMETPALHAKVILIRSSFPW